jgi:hypothetical protein
MGFALGQVAELRIAKYRRGKDLQQSFGAQRKTGGKRNAQGQAHTASAQKPVRKHGGRSSSNGQF